MVMYNGHVDLLLRYAFQQIYYYDTHSNKATAEAENVLNHNVHLNFFSFSFKSLTFGQSVRHEATSELQ